MRRFAAGALAGLLVLALGWTAAPPTASAAVAGPKVVLVVGATHGATDSYRRYMNVVAAAAARYTPNIVKVYSPNATWPAVRSALQGASIVVHMGHGNGFPSPYASTLNTSKQNGMGLNEVAGAGDSNTKYYGEKYIADEVDLAPNALVILSHLCYASGNSEPGRAEPTLSVAKQRMDNFAAGFLRAGARAVIAEGHSDPSWYIHQVFTRSRTIEQIWRTGPSPNGNIFTFASSRSAGYTVWADPDHRSGGSYSGYYRSLVTKPTVTSDQVIGFARTDTHPTSFAVPGAAEVVAPEGVGLYPDATLANDPGTGLPPALVATGTRLRLLAAAGVAPDGAAIYEVAEVGGEPLGYVAATGLTPRDGTSPRFWEVDAGAAALSPDGDGSGDRLTIAARVSEAVAWRVDIAAPDGRIVAGFEGSGDRLTVAWDALVDGRALDDGVYRATLSATDGWGNPPTSSSVDLVVDTVEPTLDGLATQGTDVPVFTPNGDRTTDTVRAPYVASEAGTIRVTVRAAGGARVASFTAAMAAGAGATTWDGRTDAGGYAPDGTYAIELLPVDRAGNAGGTLAVAVVSYGALGYVSSTVAAFHSRDGDRFARSTGLSFRLLAPATVTWEILDAAGTPVYTRLAAVPLAAGTYAWPWAGKLPDGRYVAPGLYRTRVTATDGVTSVSQTARVVVDAFRVTLSDATPSRGQLVTATVISSEPLGRNPRLTVGQPGLAAVTVATTKVATRTYRATFRLATGGTVGQLSIRVVGVDLDGGRNLTTLAFAMV